MICHVESHALMPTHGRAPRQAQLITTHRASTNRFHRAPGNRAWPDRCGRNLDVPMRHEVGIREQSSSTRGSGGDPAIDETNWLCKRQRRNAPHDYPRDQKGGTSAGRGGSGLVYPPVPQMGDSGPVVTGPLLHRLATIERRVSRRALSRQRSLRSVPARHADQWGCWRYA